MIDLAKEDINVAKTRGFLLNRGTNCFSGRIVVAGGVYTSEQLTVISECAKKYGNGRVAFTVRQSAEVVGIPFEKIDDAIHYIESQKLGLEFGGTGRKVRPITACKGTTCVFGCCDTQKIAAQLHKKFYLGNINAELPHKFKIAVGGCANGCIKPSTNDAGIEAVRQRGGAAAFKIYFGGTWGRNARAGTEYSHLVAEEDLETILDRAISWYCDKGSIKERFGATIDRVGIDSLEQALK